MRSIALAVPKAHAEEVRKKLLGMGLLRKGVAVLREGDTVYIPATAQVDLGYPTAEREFRETFTPIRSYKEVANVPSDLKPLLPTSFDVVGDIAIIRIPEELARFEGEIAKAILKANVSVHVVAADSGVKGPLRIRDLRVLAGPDRTETVHRECGLAYRVDVAKAYFSPRLASERLRVAELVQPGEAVVDLYAGVGPYAILIAKRRQPRVVYAFDANRDAFRCLEENVRINRATCVEPRHGDAQELLKDVEPPDRVIIDYPQDPDPAYRAVLPRMLPNGVLHYYAILETVEREEWAHALVKTARELDRDAEVLRWREVHGWSPTHRLFVFDVRIL